MRFLRALTHRLFSDGPQPRQDPGAAASPETGVDEEAAPGEATARVAGRREELWAQHRGVIARRTDRLFAGLLLAEWLAGMVVAWLISPRTWAGLDSHVHPHVWASILLGGLVVLPPASVAWRGPGRRVTRHAVAVAQMLMSSLLIHLTGGRIETHFIIFGSLAFLAFYRDWTVLLTATVVVAVDHFTRGLLAPASVYGVLVASPWRWLEHAWWVLFENLFLVASCIQGQREMRAIADRLAQLEVKKAVELDCAQAQSANRAKSEFLANMSHEIRTPMTAVLGFADLLLDPELTADERLGYVQTIRRNGDHLLRVINDVLDLSKIEAGKIEVESVSCSPRQIIADVASLMGARAIEKKLAFEVRYVTAIPEGIHSDPTRVRQILMNVVGNAVKFTESGRILILVRLDRSDEARPRLSLEVTDTGIGIAKTSMARLFQPFSQADTSTTRRFGGTGLGLVISQRMASMLCGKLTVESEEGRGTSVILTLPTGPLAGVRLVDTFEADKGAPVRACTIAPEPRILLPGHILLAEDGRDNQILISTHLRSAGATVTIAENGRIAAEKALAAWADGQPFDLILMDMQMPELDGYGATSRLRSLGYLGPVVALTAHAMTGDRERCLAVGCDDYLTKPVDRAQLVALAASHIARSS